LGDAAGGGGPGTSGTDSPAESWLLVVVRSFEDVATRAVLVSDFPPAAASTRAVRRTRVDPCAASGSRRQVTLRPETEQCPSSAFGVPDTRSPGGRWSVTTTSRAVDGPALEIRSVKTTSSPTSASGLDTLFTRLTSVSTTTRLVTVSALSASSGSRVGEETVAVLVTVPRAAPATVAVMVMVAVRPSAREPSRQSTVVPAATTAHLPTVVVAAAPCRSSSSRSVTLTPVAAAGPLLCTLTV
jgi:hypothetical protein